MRHFSRSRHGTAIDVSGINGGFDMALHTLKRIGAATAAVAGLGALLAGCSTQTAPMALSCEPNQRALVRQVVVNGAPQAQLQCESVAPGAVATTGTYGAASPVAYAPAAAVVPVGYSQAPIGDARLVRTAYTEPVVTRQSAPQRVVYQSERPRRYVAQPKRTVKKSAIIIGSSVGVGAGLGAAIGGKKGAGIGALVGGGGAALWDQLTRRR
jgi:hypothetical protein